jgi:photosystem II stability/assembly factor-like uncharacterized protein
MKKYILWCCLLCFFQSFLYLTLSQQYWLPLSTPVHQTLRTIYFIDSQTGWAAGDSGIIVHTMDGGLSWEVQQSNISTQILDIFFIDELDGWAISLDLELPVFGTILLHTQDGGSSWNNQLYPQENIFFRTILFQDSLNGWMGGENGALVYTVDGGNSWTPAAVDSGVFAHFPIINLSFYNQQLAFACGGAFDLAGVIWRTNDSGQHWFSRGVAPEPIQQLWIFDSLRVMGVGGDYEYGVSIIRSDDGGENWNYSLLPTFGIARAVDFRNPREAWAPLGLANKFIFSQDSGNTWQEYLITDSIGVFEVTFPDSQHGYSPGTDGKILRYNSFLANTPQLLSPANGATGIPQSPTLTWLPMPEASVYHLQVALQPDFSTLLINNSSLNTTNYLLTNLTSGTIFYWRIRGENSSGYSRWSAVWNFTTSSSSGFNPVSETIPEKFYLSPNYPNPFNSETHFEFGIPVSSEAEIIIWDISGRKIFQLLKNKLPAGEYQISWNGENFPSGIYLLNLQVLDKSRSALVFKETRKIILLK